MTDANRGETGEMIYSETYRSMVDMVIFRIEEKIQSHATKLAEKDGRHIVMLKDAIGAVGPALREILEPTGEPHR